MYSVQQYESVKSQNAELHDRVEAAELQTQKMKQDYRSQIENKEVIRILSLFMYMYVCN